MDTPRRAGPSVAGAGDDDVAAFRDFPDHRFIGGNRSAALAPGDDCFDAVFGREFGGEVFDQKIKIGLGVVDEADGFALEAIERAAGELRQVAGGCARIINAGGDGVRVFVLANKPINLIEFWNAGNRSPVDCYLRHTPHPALPPQGGKEPAA